MITIPIWVLVVSAILFLFTDEVLAAIIFIILLCCYAEEQQQPKPEPELKWVSIENHNHC